MQPVFVQTLNVAALATGKPRASLDPTSLISFV